MSDERVAIRTCPLCEATCGLRITMRGDEVTDIRGDDEDVFSHGYICPKGTTLGALHADPDRVRSPLVKRDGTFVAVSWDEAFAEIESRLGPILAARRDAVALYIGNPVVHNVDALAYVRPLAKALGTTRIFTAATVDQRPKELTSGLMFGAQLSIAVPDIDRTQYLVVLGANPFESNGSLATAPDWPGRMKAIRARGGKVVVVDPRRTQTAEHADEHIAIRPGGDAAWLAAVANVLFAEGLVALGRLEPHVKGLENVRDAVAPFTPEAVAASTGIDAEVTRRIAREIAAAESAAVYGRMGTTTQRFGTLASWLVDVVNALTGNLDEPGGAMFTTPAAGAANTRGAPGSGRGVEVGRWKSAVRGLEETYGELPASALAEEIDEAPDAERIRALITLAGNPVLSTPDAARLDRALGALDFMIAIDIYVNETSRHADVILPPPSALQRSHYDLAFYLLSVRNVANYSPAILPLRDGQMHEWEILAKLALIAQGAGASVDPAFADEFVCRSLVELNVRDAHSPIAGRGVDEIMAMLEPRRGPERLLDLMLRTGPYGDGFGATEGGLTLSTLEASPHGVDLGPLQSRIPEMLRTPDGMVDLAPARCLDDLPRLRESLAESPNGELLLIGRRHVRTNNSWLHNVPSMVKGRDRCTLLVHPDDAARFGVKDGEDACVRSEAGEVRARVEVTEDIRAGVVSLPHGWGHDLDGVELSVARAHPGVNVNVLSTRAVDPASGNAVLNGVPVTLEPA